MKRLFTSRDLGVTALDCDIELNWKLMVHGKEIKTDSDALTLSLIVETYLGG